MSPEEFSLVDSIPGWLTEQEAGVLYEYAKGNSVVVELGSWKGRSTAALAFALPWTLYAVDHWRGSSDEVHGPHAEAAEPGMAVYREFLQNMAGLEFLGNPVLPITADHIAATSLVREPVDLLFVDGEHSEEAVVCQLEAWLPKVVSGGVVMFHDAQCSGVSAGISKFGLRVSFVQSIAIHIKE